MSDDATNRDPLEQQALDVVLAYYAGTESLESAVRAIRAVSELPSPDVDEEPLADDDADAFVGFDATVLTPEHRARYDALMRALEVDLPDTA